MKCLHRTYGKMKNSTRFPIFSTGCEEWPLATHGGTALMVKSRGRPYLVFPYHILGDFNINSLLVRVDLNGLDVVKIHTYRRFNGINDVSKGGEIEGDLTVCSFAQDVKVGIFGDLLSLHDFNSRNIINDEIAVRGFLKDECSIIGSQVNQFALEMTVFDDGPSAGDHAVRRASARFEDAGYSSLAGLSGSPMFNKRTKRIAGIVVRGVINKGKVELFYIDATDIFIALNSASSKLINKYFYNKTVGKVIYIDEASGSISLNKSAFDIFQRYEIVDIKGSLDQDTASIRAMNAGGIVNIRLSRNRTLSLLNDPGCVLNDADMDKARIL